MSRWNELENDSDAYPSPNRRGADRGGGGGGVLVLLGRMAFVLAAAGVVGGAIYLGLRHSASVTDEAGIPLIRADNRPTKTKPTVPGGMAVPDQDKLVFDRLDPDSAPPVIERLLPPPEVPLPRPVAPPTPVASTTADGAGSGAATASVPGTPGKAPTAASGSAPGAPGGANAATPAAPTGPANAGSTGAKPTPAPKHDAHDTKHDTHDAKHEAHEAPPATGAKHPAPTSANGKEGGSAPPATVAAPQPSHIPQTPVAATTPPAHNGHYHIQLGSVHSEADAHAEWKRLQSHHHDVLGGLSLSVVRADLGDRGIFYRLQAGPMDENRGRTICAELQNQNVGCQLVGH